jgi:hypothetical protein
MCFEASIEDWFVDCFWRFFILAALLVEGEESLASGGYQ